MEIDKKKINTWLKLSDHGDLKLLKEFTGVKTYTTLKRAFNGVATPDLIMKIDEFFENKMKSLNIK